MIKLAQSNVYKNNRLDPSFDWQQAIVRLSARLFKIDIRLPAGS